jgi:hypothetical protein
MCVRETLSDVQGTSFDEANVFERAQKIHSLPELRSQSELNVVAPRSTMFSRLCCAAQRFL